MKKIIGKTLSIIVLLSLIFAGGSFGYINGYDNGIKNMNAALAWEIDRTYDCMQKLNAIDVDIEINKSFSG